MNITNFKVIPENYGDKRDYAKIDLYFGGLYQCSTTWAANLLIARVAYSKKSGVALDDLVAKYAENKDKFTYWRKSQ